MSASPDRTRASLVEATARLVREVGYAGLTTRAIARSAGVAEGTMYRHFPDKASLVLAALQEQHRPVVESVGRLPARAGQGTVAGNLAECLRELATLREAVLPLELARLTDPELSRQEVAPGADLGPPTRIAEYLDAERKLGRVRADLDPQRAAMVLLAALFGLAAAPLPPAAGTAGDLLGYAVELLVEGIAPAR
jgi:AcrR family transcriptional regulator